jgi:hypothetical protein
MQHQTSPTPHGKNRLRVLPGLRLEVNFDIGCATIRLTPDEALSLSMALLYETREQLAPLQESANREAAR